MQVGEFLERSQTTLAEHFRAKKQTLPSGHFTQRILVRLYGIAMDIRSALVILDFKTELGGNAERIMDSIDIIRIQRRRYPQPHS